MVGKSCSRVSSDTLLFKNVKVAVKRCVVFASQAIFLDLQLFGTLSVFYSIEKTPHFPHNMTSEKEKNDAKRREIALFIPLFIPDSVRERPML